MTAEDTTVSPGVGRFSGGALLLSRKFPENARVKPLDPLQDPDWDALVRTHPSHSFFYGAAWAKALQSTYGYRPVYLTPDGLSPKDGVLPMMEVDSWLTGRRGVSLPFTDSCAPLCADKERGCGLWESAIAYGKIRKWKSVEIRGGRQFFSSSPASVSFYGHNLELDGDPDRMFGRFEGSVRRAVRKAQKNDVTVSVSNDLDAVRIFYSLLRQTRRKHGLPPQPFAFFQNIHRNILSKNLGVIVIASWRRKPIAASVYFWWGNRAIYKYGASDESMQHLRGANLVMWEAIRWLASRGVRALDFGRTSLWNEGLRRFKLGWGAEEMKLEYFKYDFRKDQFVCDLDAAQGWHNRLFRVMPSGISRWLGAVLYRHWA